MANPNKTVGKWRRKVGFPVSEPSEKRKADFASFSDRVDIAIQKKSSGEWSDKQCEQFINTGEI